MTPDEYVAAVLAKYEVQRGPNSPAEKLAGAVAGPIRAWAGQWLAALQYSGSYAKGTGVRGVTDVDIFISLRSETPGTLKDLYQGVFDLALREGWSPRKQNVSIGITQEGTRGDLVPGRIQRGYQNYHSLYRHKTDSWTQTNVVLHTDTVKDSGRAREIRAVKIWRFLRTIDFPSLYLELFVIRALSGRRRETLADNVLDALATVGDALASTRIEDPANTNNVLSDELSESEKQNIARLARESVREGNWANIIW